MRPFPPAGDADAREAGRRARGLAAEAVRSDAEDLLAGLGLRPGEWPRLLGALGRIRVQGRRRETMRRRALEFLGTPLHHLPKEGLESDLDLFLEVGRVGTLVRDHAAQVANVLGLRANVSFPHPRGARGPPSGHRRLRNPAVARVARERPPPRRRRELAHALSRGLRARGIEPPSDLEARAMSFELLSVWALALRVAEHGWGPVRDLALALLEAARSRGFVHLVREDGGHHELLFQRWRDPGLLREWTAFLRAEARAGRAGPVPSLREAAAGNWALELDEP